MRPSPGSRLASAVLAGVAAGGAALLTASRSWAQARVSAPGTPTDIVSISGARALPLLAALALVTLAGSAAVLPTAATLRRAVGVVVVAAGLAGAVLAATADVSVRRELAAAIAAAPASVGGAGGPAPGTELSWWRWGYVLAAVAGSAAGGAVAWRGHTWPAMGSRYEAPGAAKDEGDTDQWRALDAGEDPTA